MKITHNKVGQNLNLVDGAKTERAKGNATSSPATTPSAVGADALSQLGASKVDVSTKAQEAKRIKELAKAAPDVDMEKVAKFRQLIDEGKYKVDAKAVAERLVDDELSLQDLKN
ncbi:flagellar biosynthesis anti-sigma factor FlgM [Bdellovibrio sp. HCB337]|uniref:flagellar biosynthesis anti-sigma factor FlgM n=1 Tax=Bdellovibrio sp. HCB337 TaxID=3394358 RepID=UPI0039A5520F